MLKIAAIGLGSRLRNLTFHMEKFKISFKVTQVVDPDHEKIKSYDEPWFQGCEIFDDIDAFLENADVDGVMIGTHCCLHTPLACKLKKLNLPLFIEKPIAINIEQVQQLACEFADYTPPIIVSFPLRLAPLIQKVKELLSEGAIGEILNIAAWNDVSYGRVYYHSWYRNFDEMGGLFLQKATHDFDCLYYLLGSHPSQICAMNSRHVFGGDKPHELRCRNCNEKQECIESPFNRFYKNHELSSASNQKFDWCVFSKDIKTEDSGCAIIEYENSVQATYTQNFFVKNKAGRRGARLYGYDGTLEFEWETGTIKVFEHHRPSVTQIEFSISPETHFGGDIELSYDFLMALKESKPSRSTLSDGIISALTCLKARESAETRKFCDIGVEDVLK